MALVTSCWWIWTGGDTRARRVADDLREDRQRDLLRRARADVEARRGVDARAVVVGDLEGCDHRLAALAARHEAHVGDADVERGGQRVLLVAPVRGDDERGVVGRRLASADVVADAGGRAPRAPGRSACRRSRAGAAGTRGSRKISSAPPLMQGLWTVTAPSSAALSPSPGSIRSSSGSPVSSTRSACRRTLGSAQWPPTNPSIVPSPSTSAVAPGCTLAGRPARTTVASTYGTRSASSAAARRASRSAITLAFV